ncbi:MAG: glycosyltransferase 87 family protein [Nitrososphaerota archaeon]
MKKIIISSATLSFIASYLLHHPKIQGYIYSDIVSFWYRPLVRDVKIPYIQEGFEYPPLSGLITYISSLIGRGELIPYYNSFSLILFVFYMFLVLTVSRIMEERRNSFIYIFIYLIFAPTMIFYLNYNFDVVFVAFLILSLMYFEKGRHKLSALLFSIATLTKLINIILLPILLLHMKDWRDRFSYIFYFILPVAIVNVVLQLLNPSFFKETYIYHAEWGLENAWFVYLFPSRDSWDTAKLFSATLMVYGLLKMYVSNIGDLYEKSFILLSVFLLTNYVFTPQMLIFLLPFLAVISNSFRPIFYILELANVGIILTWFMEEDPLLPGTLPQNLALIRAATLLYMLTETYLKASGKKMNIQGLVKPLLKTRVVKGGDE